MDGAALANMIKPSAEDKTFSDYAFNRFVPYVTAQLHHVKRIDIVWDTYTKSSLKGTTRNKRGEGVRQRVALGNKLPRNWSCFLRNSQNKQELFQLLAECATSIDSREKQIISSCAEDILSSNPLEDMSRSRLAPCSHEEADTRMFLHVVDAVQAGYTKISVRTVDTDVLVLAVALTQKLQILSQDSIELWVAFGTGANLRYIAAHEISRSLTANAALALPAFHAFTGCDTVSCFYGKSKKTAMETISHK